MGHGTWNMEHGTWDGVIQNAQCNKTSNATERPMFQKTQPKKNAQIPKNVKKSLRGRVLRPLKC